MNATDYKVPHNQVFHSIGFLQPQFKDFLFKCITFSAFYCPTKINEANFFVLCEEMNSANHKYNSF